MKSSTNYYVCHKSGKIRQIVCKGVAHNLDRQAKTLHEIAREEKHPPSEYQILYRCPNNNERKEMFFYPEKKPKERKARKPRLSKPIEEFIFDNA